jgi:hypothetical protein
MTVGLSAKGLLSLPRNVYEDDFIFIVGDSHYKCSSVFAAFFSHQIGSLHLIDPTIREFHSSMKDRDKYFSKIIDLCSGSTMPVDLEDRDFSSFVGEFVENYLIMNCMNKTMELLRVI